MATSAPATSDNASNSSLNLSNASNVTVCTRSLYACDREVRAEAKLACREYEGLGVVSDRNCRFWEDYASQACHSTCMDCEAMAKEIYNSCLFLLQTVISFAAARPKCKRSEMSFLRYRCPSATIDKINECYTEEYERCNALCGNYNYAPGVQRDGCVCVQDRTAAGAPDTCSGQTVLSGFVAGMEPLKHSCRLIPDDCKNHRPTTCGHYKHCPVDVCVVMNVSCPQLDSCQSNGVCGKGDGRCYYLPLLDGEACDDGLSYTHSDTCFDGRCVGIANKCVRDRVNCSTSNPCLRLTDKVPGGCDTGTGHCVFEHLPEGAPCASRALAGAAAADGRCSGGLCRRAAAAAFECRSATCPRPGQCYEAPACSPEAGCGPAPPRPEGSPCDDGDRGTHGDRCVEGRCVGDPSPEPRYGEPGRCEGQPPQAGGLLLPWRRYSADVPDLEDCKAQCSADAECRAFSYGYTTCSIFGTERLRDPDEGLWGRPWVLETAPARVEYATACYEKGDEGYRELSPERQALLALSICVVLLLPLIWLTAMGRGVLRRSLVRLLHSRDTAAKSALADAPPSPGGGGTKVAPAPVAIVERPVEGNEIAVPEGEALAHIPDPRGEVQLR